MALRWYVLRSKPYKEMALWGEVTARGFECFFPQARVKPVNPRNRKTRPYFPGYLFLHIDIEQVGDSTFKWMPFSSGFVSFGGEPATVSDPLIQAIRRHVEEVYTEDSEETTGLRRGDVVVIESGQFEGYEAIFDARIPGRKRARVLLRLLHARQINVELPATQIKQKKQR